MDAVLFKTERASEATSGEKRYPPPGGIIFATGRGLLCRDAMHLQRGAVERETVQVGELFAKLSGSESNFARVI
jgi:hypothetical protein